MIGVAFPQMLRKTDADQGKRGGWRAGSWQVGQALVMSHTGRRWTPGTHAAYVTGGLDNSGACDEPVSVISRCR
jgi:hypothetical protein